jgi:hypothetical protein
MEPGALHILGKGNTTELHPQPLLILLVPVLSVTLPGLLVL